MGLQVDRDEFEEAEYAEFAAKLGEAVGALDELLARPGFGQGPATLGAELEVNLVDAAGAPATVNRAVLADAIDPRFALEIDRFNLEFNASPVPLVGRPFAALGDELRGALEDLERAAVGHGARLAVIGILPTVELSDLQRSALSELPRYRALNRGLRRLRQAPFQVRIQGEERLEVECDDVTLEGANTSLQLHLRVDPQAYARTYNAAQIATAAALAAAGNAPFFLGRALWDETRIALFKQSADDRAEPDVDGWPPSRVTFGYGWVRRGAHELFAETAALYAPVIPLLSDEDPRARVRAGEVPALQELCLHNGTVWRWNRAVYDPADGGHLRIEFRALPAGPTVTDMLANAAFLLGLTLGLAPEADRLVVRLPFAHAHRNFYRAAQRGLDAELLWPTDDPPSPQRVRARELVPALLHVARRGLVEAGVAADEADPLLEVIRARAASGQTGAAWLRRTAARLHEPRPGRPFVELLDRYLERATTGEPVHTWSPG